MSADPGSFAYFSGGRAFGWFGGSTLGFDHLAGGRFPSAFYATSTTNAYMETPSGGMALGGSATPTVHTTITTASAGNWSSTSTWTGGVVPVAGDAVVLNHDVTADVDVTIGNQTNAITISTGINLTVAAGKTLVVRGNVAQGDYTTVTFGSGSALEFDASGAASPSTTTFSWTVGSLENAKIVCNGTSGSHVAIRSNAGGGNGYFTCLNRYGVGSFDCTFADFLRIGDATNNAAKFAAGGVAGYGASFADCTFDTCGTFKDLSGGGAGDAYSFQRCVWSNSLGSDCLYLSFYDALTTGTRLVDSCVFDQRVSFVPPLGATITNNYFHLKYSLGSDGDWAEFSNNVVRLTSGSAALLGSMVDTFVYMDSTAANPHFLVGGSGTTNLVLDGLIYGYAGTDDTGDCYFASDVTPTGATVTIQRCIVLPNAGGSNSGTLFSCGGNANLTVTAEHNTVCAEGQVAGGVGETYDGFAGMVASFRANLCWGTGSTGRKYRSLSSVVDIGAPSNVDYNAGYLLDNSTTAKPYSGNGYNADFSAAPGVHDLDGVDPDFVDSTRNFLGYDSYKGGSGTSASMLAGFQSGGYTVSEMLTWVRAGFVPQAAAYKGASYPGDPLFDAIGAMEGSSGTAYSETPSGGMELGGIVTPAAAYAPSPAGGMALGGEASILAAYAPSPAGGMALGGVVTVSGTSAYVETPSGGMALGGSLDALAAYAVSPAGGMALGGSVSISGSSAYTETPSGGTALGGEASVVAAFAPAASGGLALGGSTAGVAAYGVVPSGGLAMGGVVVVSGSGTSDYLETCTGGMALGGSVHVSYGSRYVVSPWACVRLPSGRVDPSACVAKPSGSVVPWAAVFKR